MKLNLSVETLQQLRQLFYTKESNNYAFLGFALDLEKGEVKDKLACGLKSEFYEWHIQVLSVLLSHYSKAKPSPLTGNLVKFKDLPGGCAYEGAFEKRAINPIVKFFGKDPNALLKAGRLLGGVQLSHGDSSVQVIALAGIPLTYILWAADEFPAAANILYDSSASDYLQTEDLAVLGELTTVRLIDAENAIRKN